jgi:hypothetical protein
MIFSDFASLGAIEQSARKRCDTFATKFYGMNNFSMLVIAGCILGGILLIYLFSYFADKRLMRTSVTEQNNGTLQLQLQAYERLVLLTDRISLPNLVSRVNQPDLNAREMQQLMLMNIKQEFEHNITQQIYVAKEAWEAVQSLKEQNMLIINQVASFLPETATSQDLSRSLMELLVQNPDASLHGIVSEALRFEARKLMS